MRKKSHILLARYLADQMMEEESLQNHRKAFCLGNILPDIQPSFFTKKHEFYGTFEETQKKIRFLVENGPERCRARVFWRRLGEILHYVADYFTFPHNRTYTGTLYEHGQYEKALKKRLKTYIESGEAYAHQEKGIAFQNTEQIGAYVCRCHAAYLEKKRNITDDISYILSVCFQVSQGLLRLCMQKDSRGYAY